MSEAKIYQLTVHPQKRLARYGMAGPAPRMQVLYPGETEYRICGRIQGFDYEQTYKYVIEIEDAPRTGPMLMDAPSNILTLIRIISKEKCDVKPCDPNAYYEQ